jgi:hypothetical protein
MENNQLQIVSFEQAWRLKALGFDWNTEWFYRDNLPSPADTLLHQPNNAIGDHNACIHRFSAPTVAHALKWMRDENGIVCAVDWFFDEYPAYRGSIIINGMRRKTGGYDTYEAAEAALLDELLTLIEKEK